MVLAAASYSPRGAGLVSPRHRQCVTASLISASGDQDHTTWPSAPGIARLATPPRPPHPALNTPDDAQRPSCERGMKGEKHEFPKNGSGIFSQGGLDRG